MNNPADTLAALADEIETAALAAPLVLGRAAIAISPAVADDWISRLRALASLKREAAKPKFTTGHCENHRKPGGCHLHNLQCGYPECDRRPVESTPSPAPQGGGEEVLALLAELARALPPISTEQPATQNMIQHNRRERALQIIGDFILRATPPAQQPGEVGELLADLLVVLDAAKEASAVPLQWQASTDFTPEQAKEWLANAVSENVRHGDFTGELHSIAELESGLTVAFTGCGPKSAGNAKFLIGCVHFILKHRATLTAALAKFE